MTLFGESGVRGAEQLVNSPQEEDQPEEGSGQCGGRDGEEMSRRKWGKEWGGHQRPALETHLWKPKRSLRGGRGCPWRGAEGPGACRPLDWQECPMDFSLLPK